MRVTKRRLARAIQIAVIFIAIAPIHLLFAYEQHIAVLIGLERYEHGQGKGIFRDLPYSKNDLEAVGTALAEIGFDLIYVYSDAKKPLGSRFEYRTLLSSQASATQIISAEDVHRVIADASELIERDTLLLVYFTGHGGASLEGVRVLAAPNSTEGNERSFASVQEILEVLAKSRALRADTMLIVDACADDWGEQFRYSSTISPELMPAYLYSSGLGEASFFDPNIKMSVFSHYFAEALRRADLLGHGDNDGIVEFEEIRDYVIDAVPKHQRKEQKKTETDVKNVSQTPWGSYGRKDISVGQTRATASREITGSRRDRRARQSGLAEAIYGGGE